ncbi:MAG: RHS repeat-associated core domain-containing protein, partial [Candidatus Rokuibacteriota bacterium]
WARTGLPPELASASYDAANRHLTFGAQVPTYDLNGNLTSDGTSGYTWDARNRLAGITGPITATYQYDATGRRTGKTINSLTTDFVHDGLNPVTESSAAGTGVLLTGLGVDDFLLRIGAGSTAMLLTDALGSVLATTDAAGGVQSELTYEPFGATEGSAPAPAYRFTGREQDDLTPLYYYRARYYHPDLQRFVSEDPIEFAGGDINLYSYVLNQPTGRRDPSGMVVDPISWTAAAIVCGGGATVGVSYMILSGRKPTMENLAAGAAVGCGAGMIALVSWIAAAGAGAVAITADIAGGVGLTSTLTQAFIITEKINRQMGPRGWTEHLIREAIDKGQRVPAVHLATGSPATRYIHPETGQSVVVDNITKVVIHVGGKGFRY